MEASTHPDWRDSEVNDTGWLLAEIERLVGDLAIAEGHIARGHEEIDWAWAAHPGLGDR